MRALSDAVLDLNTKVSPDGQLIMTDTAHLTRLSADATPFIKTAPLQKVFAEDCTATVGYAASFGNFLPSLKVQYSYYNFLNKANISDLSVFIDTATQVLNVNHRGDWIDVLDSGAASSSASFLASLNYLVRRPRRHCFWMARESRDRRTTTNLWGGRRCC